VPEALGSHPLACRPRGHERGPVMASSHWLFGPFRLDPDQACLWHGGQEVPLTPKAFRVLHYLVTHAGRLITKDALFDAVWPATAVSEAVLRVCIGEVRKALGDGARAPQFIATVPRRGYRFLAPVTRQDPVAEAVPAGAASAPRAPTASGGPLVGREAVLARLHAAWAQARQGVRQVCFVIGDAGIGKTAVVEAFAAQVTADTTVWRAQGQCVEPYGTREAYRPVLAALGQLIRAPGGDRLVALLRQQAPTWLVQLPGVLTDADRVQFQPELQGTTRERMLREFAEVVETLTAETPLLLVLEDLHWSDYATLDLLALLARRRAPARLLLLGTYRAAEVIVHAHPLRTMAQTLQRDAHCQDLWLALLTGDEVAAYVHGRFGGSRVPMAWARALHQRTEGHPLFLITVVEALVRQGAVVQVGGTWELPGGGDGGVALIRAVPDSVRDLIAHQCEDLSPAEHQVLEAASVVGMACTVAAVAAGLEADESLVDDICATLARRRQFLEPSDPACWPDGTHTAGYRFRHSLYQEVLYHRTPLGRRQRLHQRIGVREEAGYGARASERAAELAEHFARGGDAHRAVHYLRQAGDNALARSAYREAVACYEQALAAVPQLPASRATDAQALELHLALSIVLHHLGEATRRLRALRAAEALAVALADPRRLAQVAYSLSTYYTLSGAGDQALAAAQRALALATASGEGILHALAQQYLGYAYYAQGAYRPASACFEQTVAALADTRHQERFGRVILPAVFARTLLAVCHAHLGTFAAGRTPGDEGLQIATAVAHGESVRFAWWGVGMLALWQGDLSRALPALERAVGLCQGPDLPSYFPTLAGTLGAAYLLAGRPAEAVPLLTQALAPTAATGLGREQVYCSAILGEAQLLTGHLEDAQARAEGVLACTRLHQARGHQAYALRLLGMIAARRVSPESAQAETYYQQAIALGEEFGMRPLQAHCHRGLGMLYAATSQREQARTELSTAIEMYTSMDMTFWLPQAAAALAQMEGREWTMMPS